MADAARHTEAWQDKPWKMFQKVVFRLQKRIYRAEQRGDTRTVHKLQRLLLSSRAAHYLAARRVTQENQGKRTAGVDGIASLSPKERLALAESLPDLDGKADPIRRVYIPKPGKEEYRKLGIPTIRDRARQALVKLVLEPQWEAKFETNSYGFRPGRSAHDAISAIFLSIRYTPKYVLDADLEQCFDRISHRYLLDKLSTFPRLRRLIKRWLKAGILDGEVLRSPTAGTPQGGLASPTLMNIALHGFEAALQQGVSRRKDGLAWQPSVVRYADDVVILHRDLETLKQLQQQAEAWLAQVGLRFKPSKTHITHTLEPYQGRMGFAFLGFEVRQYKVGKYRSGKHKDKPLGFKTLIKPSKEAQQQHLQKTGQWLRQLRGVSQDIVIQALAPIIKGWSNYYAHVVSSEVFNTMDNRLHHQLRKWAKWRHPSKGYRWRMNRYWQITIHGLRFGKNQLLPKHSDTKIVRHVKVAGTRSPYDGDWVYWGQRLSNYLGLSASKQKLLKHQRGRCAFCGLFFAVNDLIERHHHDGNSRNNAFANLALVHRHCHDQLHGTRDKGCQIEKPDDSKGSCPVLQRQGAG